MTTTLVGTPDPFIPGGEVLHDSGTCTIMEVEPNGYLTILDDNNVIRVPSAEVIPT